jgi:mannose-1-phosphate guanylyltransferase
MMMILIITHDHIIDNMESYERNHGQATIWLQGYIVTFGIIPTKPEIGYGYIEKRVMM